MCGLIFLHDESVHQADLHAKAKAALEQIVHRGPDDGHLVCHAPVVSGHRRLSIIDLEASRQPMCDPSSRYTLVYNGEIYNYRKLRETLIDRWQFQSKGDTEVLLAGLVLEGAKFLERAEGMWAFALWDDEERTLLLGRDRMGKKPLYYEASGWRMACASELSALSVLAGSDREEDLNSTADYLRYGFYLPGTTAYKNVWEVLPGHTLTWKPGREAKTSPYWTIPITAYSGSTTTAQQLLRERLYEAVQRRLVADVEVGAFLSGGIDSSLVVSIVAKHFGLPLKTFTIGFEDETYDERAYAAELAEACHTDHYERCLTGWDPERLKALTVNHVGQPFADSSILPTALVSDLAAERVKVALSGDGGDELFSGYQRYQARALLRWYTRLPKSARKGIERAVRFLPEPAAHHSRSLLKKAHLFLDVNRRIEAETPYVAPAMYSREEFARLAPDLSNRGHAPPNLPEETRLDEIHRMMLSDALVYLPQDVLLKVDRASMASSLEVRTPFLDTEMVSLAFSLPRTWHRGGLSGKKMLRHSFGDLLSPEIWRRRKQGFAVPIHRWFREGLGDEFAELVRHADGPLNLDAVRKLLVAHRQCSRDHGYRLWNLYQYLLWKDTVKKSES